MSTRTLHIPNIGCDHCVAFIRNELAKIGGVKRVSGDVRTKNIVVDWDEPATLQEIKERLKAIGYPADET